MKYLKGLLAVVMLMPTLEARSMFTAINEARKRANKALGNASNKAMSFSLNDLFGKKRPIPMVITPELLRSLGSPAAYEQLQKTDALFGKLFWAEQHDLVAALALVAQTKAQEARAMQKIMLKKAMVEHAKTETPSMLALAKELVTEEALLADILTGLVVAADELKNSASIEVAAYDVKALHDRRNKALLTLQLLSGVLADLLAI